MGENIPERFARVLKLETEQTTVTTQQPIDPLAQEIARFLVGTYLPRLVRMIRQSISRRSLGWFALAATVIAAPFVVMVLLRASGRRPAAR